jgi:CubicO group peptidase (beta-lactamase class C family)
VAQEVLEPLGLADTFVGDPEASGSRHAAGAMFSTMDDLSRFGVALFRDRSLVSRSSLERMIPRDGEIFGAGLWALCPCAADGTDHVAAGHPGETAVLYWFRDSGTIIALDLDETMWVPSGRPGQVDALAGRLDRLVTAGVRP